MTDTAPALYAAAVRRQDPRLIIVKPADMAKRKSSIDGEGGRTVHTSPVRDDAVTMRRPTPERSSAIRPGTRRVPRRRPSRAGLWYLLGRPRWRRIRCTTDDCSLVVEAGATSKYLVMGETLMATPALSDGVVYVRGATTLFAIGKK